MSTIIVSNKGMPYIGVTDFMSHVQVTLALKSMSSNVRRRLHVGHMMSYKTFHAIKTATGWENIWLRGEKLQALFQPHPNVFNVLHWADYQFPYFLSEAADIVQACKEAGPHLQGLQLDMIWPRRDIIEAIKSELPHLEIILQLGKVALLRLDKEFGHFDKTVAHYSECVDYFLVDWGMGRGEPIDAEIASTYVDIACEIVPERRVAIAGGLGPTTYEVLRQFLKKYPLLSCDAQGQMRSSGKATDPIEMERVCMYVSGVCSLL